VWWHVSKKRYLFMCGTERNDYNSIRIVRRPALKRLGGCDVCGVLEQVKWRWRHRISSCLICKIDDEQRSCLYRAGWITLPSFSALSLTHSSAFYSVCSKAPSWSIVTKFIYLFIKPPPPIGAGGGYMFSGRPSVPLSVRASVSPCVRPWFTW